jgi:hypothetical protein
MAAAKRTRRTATQPTQPPPRLEDCHELARAAALELAGGDRSRLQPLDEYTIRIVNQH